MKPVMFYSNHSESIHCNREMGFVLFWAKASGFIVEVCSQNSPFCRGLLWQTQCLPQGAPPAAAASGRRLLEEGSDSSKAKILPLMCTVCAVSDPSLARRSTVIGRHPLAPGLRWAEFCHQWCFWWQQWLVSGSFLFRGFSSVAISTCQDQLSAVYFYVEKRVACHVTATKNNIIMWSWRKREGLYQI